MTIESRLEEQEKIHQKGGACDQASVDKWTAIDKIGNRVTRLETIIWVARVCGPLIVQGLFEIWHMLHKGSP